MTEIWKNITSYEGLYQVSNFGRVRSVRLNKILSPKHNWDGYLRIQLWRDNKNKYVFIHRLVAEAFIPNADNKPFVNHIDGNKSNDRVDNLEWCTQKENIKHAFATGLSTPCPKNWNRLSKAVLQCDCNGNVLREFPSQMEVERTLGISHSNISYACKHNGTAGGYVWRYAECGL